MKPIVIAFMAVTLVRAADKTQDAGRQLKAAMNAELVDGNLKSAIEQYKKVAQSGIRPVAAQALLHMAECYQKLGDTQSRGVYERVVKEYADQKESVAIARARLGGAARSQNAGIVTRQVWAGPKVDAYGSVSPDGRLLSFTDWDTGDLALHDLTTGQDRHLTNKGTWEASGEYAGLSVISRDGKQVAFTWSRGNGSAADNFSDLRVMDLNGGKPRVLAASKPDVEHIAPMDWSPDGRWIAADLGRTDSSQIALVSTADGAVRVLKSTARRDASKIMFSPNGKYLAYAVPAEADSDRWQIHVQSVDGGQDTSMLTPSSSDRVLGWSLDGNRLLFASDRGGLSGVWVQPMMDGKPQGEAELVKDNIEPNPLGMTKSGALFYSTVASALNIYLTSVDFATGKLLSPLTILQHTHVGLNTSPQWSPDGKYLAYLSRRDSNTRSQQMTRMTIRSVDSGKDRELLPKVRFMYPVTFTLPVWAPDANSLIVNAVGQDGVAGIYRIDARSGEASLLVPSQTPQTNVRAQSLSPDGRTLYLMRTDARSKLPALVARDLESGREREILRRGSMNTISLSPDGRLFAVTAFDKQWGSVLLVPVEGGEPRELVRTLNSGPESVGSYVRWLPDGKSLLIRKGPVDGAVNGRETFRLPLEGGTAVKYGAEWTKGPASINPDGHQVAVMMGEHKIEVWTMENFPPAVKASK